MVDIFRKNRFFIIPYLVFILFSTYFLVFFSKAEIHIFLNDFYHPVADVFFKYITYLGDGLAVALFIIILLFISYRYFLIELASVLFTTIVVQTLKRLIFSDSLRPEKYFSGIYELHLVAGVKMHHFNSFPSGHTASAFGLFFLAALICKNNMLKLLFFVISLLTACSRVYLSQHFLVDIYFGSIISMLIVFFMYNWGIKWENPKLDASVLKKH